MDTRSISDFSSFCIFSYIPCFRLPLLLESPPTDLLSLKRPEKVFPSWCESGCELFMCIASFQHFVVFALRLPFPLFIEPLTPNERYGQNVYSTNLICSFFLSSTAFRTTKSAWFGTNARSQKSALVGEEWTDG